MCSHAMAGTMYIQSNEARYNRDKQNHIIHKLREHTRLDRGHKDREIWERSHHSHPWGKKVQDRNWADGSPSGESLVNHSLGEGMQGEK